MVETTQETTFRYTTSAELREFLVRCLSDREIALRIEKLEIRYWISDLGENVDADLKSSDSWFEVITTAIRSSGLYASDIYSASNSDWLQQVSGGNDEPLLCLLLIICENAVKILICPSFGSDFLRAAFNHPRRPPNVREVMVEHYDTEGGFSLRRVEPILSLPSLQKMILHMAYEETSSRYLPTDPSLRSTLKDLVIYESYVDPDILAKFLALCPDLDTLEYEENGITEPAAFTQALVSIPSICTTLRELRLSNFQDSIISITFNDAYPDQPIRNHTMGTKVSSTVPPGDDGIYNFLPERCFGSFEPLAALEILKVQFLHMLMGGPNRTLNKDTAITLLPK